MFYLQDQQQILNKMCCFFVFQETYALFIIVVLCRIICFATHLNPSENAVHHTYRALCLCGVKRDLEEIWDQNSRETSSSPEVALFVARGFAEACVFSSTSMHMHGGSF